MIGLQLQNWVDWRPSTLILLKSKTDQTQVVVSVNVIFSHSSRQNKLLFCLFVIALVIINFCLIHQRNFGRKIIFIIFLITIILGRIYCGWLCPMHLILEMNDKLRKLLLKIGYNSRNIEFNRKTKYFVLIIGLISAFFAGRPLLSLFYPPAVISRELFYKIYTGAWGNGLMIIGTIGFIELVLSRRWWCRYICPGGAIYSALSIFRRLRIKRNDLTCDLCGDCNPVCPYDLNPMNKELLSECDSCGLCVSVCKPGALKYTFSITDHWRFTKLKDWIKNTEPMTLKNQFRPAGTFWK